MTKKLMMKQFIYENGEKLPIFNEDGEMYVMKKGIKYRVGCYSHNKIITE